MANQQKYHSTFFLREKKDLSNFYTRVDFWVSLLALVLIILSLTLPRYDDTTYSQMWTLTNGNWALILCGIVSIIAMVYIFIVNVLFRNNALLSGINIGLGLLMTVLFIMEYIILTRVGAYTEDGVTYTMGNSAGIGFYFGIVGAILTVGLEFYKLGVQGYYTADDVAKENNGVEVVDGVVMIDGEAVSTANETASDNETRIRVLTDGEVQENTENAEQSNENTVKPEEAQEKNVEVVEQAQTTEDAETKEESEKVEVEEVAPATKTKSTSSKTKSTSSKSAGTKSSTAKKSTSTKSSAKASAEKKSTTTKSSTAKTSSTKSSSSKAATTKSGTKSTTTKSKSTSKKSTKTE